MGEKINKNTLWTCCYCGKKYPITLLEEGGYIDHIKIGDVVECPNEKCSMQQFIENNEV